MLCLIVQVVFESYTTKWHHVVLNHVVYCVPVDNVINHVGLYTHSGKSCFLVQLGVSSCVVQRCKSCFLVISL